MQIFELIRIVSAGSSGPALAQAGSPGSPEALMALMRSEMMILRRNATIGPFQVQGGTND